MHRAMSPDISREPISKEKYADALPFTSILALAHRYVSLTEIIATDRSILVAESSEVIELWKSL